MPSRMPRFVSQTVPQAAPLAPWEKDLISLSQIQAPELIAGLTVQVDDRFFDCSLAGRLSRLKMELAKV